VHFKEGDAVDPSKVLVEIDVERFRLAAARAKADFDRASAQTDLAKTIYANRVKLSEEAKKQNKDWITEEQLAAWRADFEKAKADLARAGVDLDLAGRDLARATVRAPIAGVINSRLVSKGEYVKAESVVAAILDVHTLYVRFSVTELEAARFKTGQELAFSIRSAPGAALKARLFFMSQKADPVTRAVECKAEVLEHKETLRTGTFAAVKIVTQRLKSIVVPDRAALPTERGFIVYVIDGDKARSRLVKLGLKTPDGVEILEGLGAGERVVVDGAGTLREGATVEGVAEAKP
jgi:RND family efflux transporter MFP subunit